MNNVSFCSCCIISESVRLGEKIEELSCPLSDISKVTVALHCDRSHSVGDVGGPGGGGSNSSTQCWAIYLDLKDGRQIRMSDNSTTSDCAACFPPPKWFEPYIIEINTFLGLNGGDVEQSLVEIRGAYVQAHQKMDDR
jgi:hypothetical protein